MTNSGARASEVIGDVRVIEFVFTIDYEVYGNGSGDLKQLVYDPGQRLADLFRKWDARFVSFTEVAEFDKIAEAGTDAAIELVEQQIKEFHRDGFEIALHLHPQWYKARYESDQWRLDYAEYNLCTLPPKRISDIVERALAYLRKVLDDPSFVPLSFRAGNWLFQPTANAARALAQHGIRLDSSVFRGGLQRNHQLDYRSSPKNLYYWPFHDDAVRPDAKGPWLEVPIHSEMVPFWKMATPKRMSLAGNVGLSRGTTRQRINRALDFARPRYPQKLDFCRMTLSELTAMVDRVIRQDKKNPEVYRPLVAIGHTKDLVDFDTIEQFLQFLRTNDIAVRTFEAVYSKLVGTAGNREGQPLGASLTA